MDINAIQTELELALLAKRYIKIIEFLRFQSKTMEENRQKREELEKFEQARETAAALQKINNATLFCSKYTCYSTTQFLSRYLTHKYAKVREAAAEAIGVVVKNSAMYIANETDPNVLKHLIANISDVGDLLEQHLGTEVMEASTRHLVSLAINTSNHGASIGNTSLSNINKESMLAHKQSEKDKKTLDMIAKTSIPKNNLHQIMSMTTSHHIAPNIKTARLWAKLMENLRVCSQLLTGATINVSDIATINTLAGKSTSLSECLSAINSITPFLESNNKYIREHAASVISRLILKAAEHLLKENNPAIVLKNSELLFKAISKLESKTSLSLPDSTKHTLNKAKKLINAKIEDLTGEKPKNACSLKDCFSRNKPFQKDTNPNQSKTSIDSATDKLTGHTTYNGFMNSLEQSIDRLFGIKIL